MPRQQEEAVNKSKMQQRLEVYKQSEYIRSINT